MPTAHRRVLIAALTCTAALTVAACGSTQDAATSPSSPGGVGTSGAAPAQGTASPDSSSTEAPLVGSTPSARGNQFTMTAGKGVTSIAFSFSGNYFISPGQESTWGGVTDCGPAGTCTFDVTAGRHDSPQTWKWFTQNATGFGCNGSSACSGGTQMNFAFTGTLDVDGTTYPLTLGQYGAAIANWWFWGGPGWTDTDDTNDAVTPDGKYTVTADGGNGNGKVLVTAN